MVRTCIKAIALVCKPIAGRPLPYCLHKNAKAIKPVQGYKNGKYEGEKTGIKRWNAIAYMKRNVDFSGT